MKRFIPLFAASALAWAAPLAAQARFSVAPGALLVASSPDGSSLSIDSVSLVRTGDAKYEIVAIYQYGRELARQNGFEQLLESEQVDCAGNRVRHLGKQAYHDGVEQPIADRDTARAWSAAAGDELSLLQAMCGTLQRSFAASLPLEYELSEVDEQPVLSNAAEVRQSIVAAFPRLLRDAGVTGSATLHMLVRPDGHVDHVRVENSTHPAFSAAAVRVAATMRFKPAEVNGQPVPAWVTLPVVFEVIGNPASVHRPASVPEPAVPAAADRTPHRPGQSATTCSVPAPACGGTP